MSNIDGRGAKRNLQETGKIANELCEKGLFSIPTIGIVFHFIKRTI